MRLITWLKMVEVNGVLEMMNMNKCSSKMSDMLVRYHSVPCSAFLEIVFKREIFEDSMKI